MKPAKLGYGKSFFNVPKDLKNFKILLPNEFPGLENPQDEIRKAIREPAGSKPLPELAKGKEKVVIVASDITRPCPSYVILPPLLEELEKAGVKAENITILFATGSHRKHTEDEKRGLLGEKVLGKIRNVMDHDSKEEGMLKLVGKTSGGTEVFINKIYCDADLKIITGNVEFHYFAGYSGGPKAVVPGIAGFRTIQHNHSFMPLENARAGLLKGNPVYEDIVEAVKFCPPDFTLNVVLNERKEIVRVAAGEMRKAQTEGIEAVDRMYKVPIAEQADMVITSAGGFPKDINLYQAQKALDNSASAVKEGGMVLLLAECRDCLGSETFEKWLYEAAGPDDVIERLKEGFVLGGHKAYAIATLAKKADLFMISGLSEEQTGKAFFRKAGSIEEVVEEARKRYGPGFKTIIMPYGGSTLPVLRKK